MEDRIQKIVRAFLKSVGAPDTAFTVERPVAMAHGDYTTNAALVVAKTLSRNPREVADDLARYLLDTLGAEVVSHVSVAGPGFVNLTLARETIALAVAEADAQGSEWGKGTEEEEKRIIVEYSNPNAFKEMHVGHLVGTIIGEAVSRLIENSGATVARDTFGGDIGPNVAKALWGLRQSGITDPTTAAEVGTAYTEGSTA
ncbi:MAG TPA: arginine--tRNA ligase, partial [Candidatus Paceibacterota bacterium]|nr:arginine--tRNA ligase [Candidatus Paceibacterota bacterium]